MVVKSVIAAYVIKHVLWWDMAHFKVQTIISADHQSITATDLSYGPGNKANT